MNNLNVLRIIGKYAVLLAIFYLIELVTKEFVNNYKPEQEYGMVYLVLNSIPMIIHLLLNVVTAIILNIEIKKQNIVAKYSVLLTIIYRPLGITLFLIYILNNKIESKINP